MRSIFHLLCFLRTSRSQRQGCAGPAGSWLVAGLLLALAAAPLTGRAQTLDSTFARTSLTLPAFTNNAVEQADGRVVVSVVPAAFYQGRQVKGIIRVTTDGSLDQSFGSGWLEAGGAARSMRVLPNGNILLVGSSFSILEYDLYRQTGVVVLHPDGTLDRQFRVRSTGNYSLGGADAAEVQPDGNILVGGSFTTVNDAPMSRLARLLPSGLLDPGFTLPAGGFNGNVTSIRVQPDGKILVGGDFTTCGGVARPHLVRLLSTGSLDPSFQPAIAPGAYFVGFAPQPDGRVVVALSSGGPGLCRLLANGSLDSSFAASYYSYLALNPQSDREVVVQPSGSVLLCGSFERAGGQPSPGLARVLADGTPDQSAAYQGSFQGLIAALCPLATGGTLVCGSFNNFTNRSTGMFRVLPTGQPDFTFVLPVGSQGSIAAVLPVAGGRLLVGGSFTGINGVTATHLAFLQPDGTVDVAATQTLPALNAPVRALANGPQGTLYVGGSFNEPAVPGRRYLLRLTSTGVQDNTFNDPGLDATVSTLGAYPDGRLLVGGSFNSPRVKLLRLNPQGVVESNFAAGFNTYVPWVSALVVQRDGKIAALTMNSSWQLGATGTVLNAPVTVPRYLHAVAVQPDGRILVAGEFSDFNGTPRTALVRLLPSGDVDGSFDAGPLVMLNNVARINALAVQSDNRILVAGYFTSIQGQSHRGLARLLPSGQLDNTFADRVLMHPEVSCLVIQPGRLLVGASSLSKQASYYLESDKLVTQGLTCLAVPGLLGPAPAGLALAGTVSSPATTAGLYPVPARDELTVQADPAAITLAVTIRDVLGRVMLQASGAGPALRLSVADLPAATYLVSISTEQGTAHRSLVVQH